MFWQNLRNVPNKINERKANSNGHFAIRISNRVHRRTVFATTCTILVVILGAIIVNSSSSRTVAYAYSVKGVGVGIYWDQACTNRTLSLDWGLIGPGSNSTVMVYIRNEGDSAVSLWMATSNWTPSTAFDNMTLIWNYSGRTLSSGEIIPMELILNIAPTVNGITNFSFDIIITATG